MVNQTGRDRIWVYSLASAVRNGNRVKPSDIAEMADVAERTARETLYVISEAGWLERHTKSDGSVYYDCPRWIDFHDDEYPE